MKRIAILFLAGCSTGRSSLHPAGPEAHKLADLGWPLLLFFTLVSAVVWGLIVSVAARRTGTFDEHVPLGTGGGMGWVAIGGFLLPAIAFAVVFVVTLRSMNSFPHMHHADMKPEIRVIGHQWWWEVQYLGADVSERVTSANELHVPLDRGVEVELVSADVIHSFWVPRLFGKVDLVPGMVNHVHVDASVPGAYEGECAEYCGLQHAKMRFTIVAEPLADYEAYVKHLRDDATAPPTVEAQRGSALFMTGPCMTCHTVRGTAARGTVGPDRRSST